MRIARASGRREQALLAHDGKEDNCKCAIWRNLVQASSITGWHLFCIRIIPSSNQLLPILLCSSFSEATNVYFVTIVADWAVAV